MQTDMNKNVFAGFVIVIIVLIGLVFFSLPKTEKESGTTVNTETNNSPTKIAPSPTPIAKSANTFKSIFSQPGSHTCSFEQLTQATASSGTTKSSVLIYIADGKMRGEFRTTMADKVNSNLMVYNGGILYSWVEGKGVGTKSALNSVSDLPFVIPTDLTSGKVIGTSENNVSWDCHDWSKNNTMLVPPSTVKFY